jgi:hypothetical protein
MFRLLNGRVSRRQLRSKPLDALYDLAIDQPHRRFIPDTESPDQSWLKRYIHPEDQQLVTAEITLALLHRRSGRTSKLSRVCSSIRFSSRTVLPSWVFALTKS